MREHPCARRVGFGMFGSPTLLITNPAFMKHAQSCQLLGHVGDTRGLLVKGWPARPPGTRKTQGTIRLTGWLPQHMPGRRETPEGIPVPEQPTHPHQITANTSPKLLPLLLGSQVQAHHAECGRLRGHPRAPSSWLVPAAFRLAIRWVCVLVLGLVRYNRPRAADDFANSSVSAFAFLGDTPAPRMVRS